MQRRHFLGVTASTLAGSVLSGCVPHRAREGRLPNDAGTSDPLNAAAFHATRQYAETRFGKISYVEQGSGDAALFLHGFPLKALCIGLMHGAAGSAGLLVLTVAATQSIAQSLVHFAVFGLGSMVGMAALSAVLSLPLAQVARGAGWMKTAVSLAIAALAVTVGGGLALESLPGLQAMAL